MSSNFKRNLNCEQKTFINILLKECVMAMSVNAFFDKIRGCSFKHLAVSGHDICKEFSKREATKAAAKLYGVHCYCFSRHFSRYLAAQLLFALMRKAGAPLIKNLFEEYGGRSGALKKGWMQSLPILRFSPHKILEIKQVLIHIAECVR